MNAQAVAGPPLKAPSSPIVVKASSKRTASRLNADEGEEGIRLLQRLISFPTTSHAASQNGAYNDCAACLVAELTGAGIEYAHILPESLPNKPIVVGKVTGTDPQLPGILLNSHYDVVPAIEADWTVPAFEGLRRDGRVYGRGAQDMKCVCAQYIVALKFLIKSGRKMRRTVFLSFVPDEEIGGIDGMNVMMQSDWFHEHGGKVELALDEGLASEGDSYTVFYGERLPWFLFFDSTGNTGHGSRFIEGTAVSSAAQVLNKALAFREQQRRLLHGLHADDAGCSHAVAAAAAAAAATSDPATAGDVASPKNLGDVTSLNITVMQAGTVFPDGKAVMNVVPASARIGMDIRISPLDEPGAVSSMLDAWCQEINTQPGNSSAKVKWDFAWPCVQDHVVTQLAAPDVSPWWERFRATLLEEFGVAVSPAIFPAATDSRFLRAHGYKALGFSPIRRSPIMLHENDEWLGEDIFLEGCEVYVAVIPSLANFVSEA